MLIDPLSNLTIFSFLLLRLGSHSNRKKPKLLLHSHSHCSRALFLGFSILPELLNSEKITDRSLQSITLFKTSNVFALRVLYHLANPALSDLLLEHNETPTSNRDHKLLILTIAGQNRNHPFSASLKFLTINS
jgi:hypothetical protein